MKIELHLIQNFAPSNLNRDDTGAPKDCELGGHRRARISSQCQKRAVREAFRLDGLIAEAELGARTKRLATRVADELVKEEYGHEREAALALAIGAIEGVGLKRSPKGEGEDAYKTEYLLFVPRRTVASLAALLHENRAKLTPAVAGTVAAVVPEGAVVPAKKKMSAKDAKAAAKKAYPPEIQKKVEALLDGARNTADLALFGRMIADKPEWNVDAACQVAHAISTNRVQMDFDFYTAVDDFKPGDTAGSDMMGTIQFNSSCFYRYAVLDVGALTKNLEADAASPIVQKTTEAFLRAFVSAIPTGKQNGMAAHNFPSYALAVVRGGGASISLTNAFLKPARPHGGGDGEKDLVDVSIEKLESYLSRVRDAMGPSGKDALLITWADRDLDRADIARSTGLDHFYEQVTKRALGASA